MHSFIYLIFFFFIIVNGFHIERIILRLKSDNLTECDIKYINYILNKNDGCECLQDIKGCKEEKYFNNSYFTKYTKLTENDSDDWWMALFMIIIVFFTILEEYFNIFSFCLKSTSKKRLKFLKKIQIFIIKENEKMLI